MIKRTACCIALALSFAGASATAQTAPADARQGAPSAAARPYIKVAPDVLATYVGRYMIDPQHLIDVTQDGERLFGQGTGLPKMELFASTQTLFFVNEIDAQLDFGKAGDGSIQLTLISEGRAMPGKKIN